MKTIRVTTISDDSLKRLQAKGFNVMVVTNPNAGEIAALERQATRALKQGDTDKSKAVRLKMLRLIKGEKQ